MSNIEFNAVKWEVSLDGKAQGVYVESTGPTGYAIRRSVGSCLNNDGLWEYEPTPSHRTDEFLKRNRYKEIKEAWDAIFKYFGFKEEHGID